MKASYIVAIILSLLVGGASLVYYHEFVIPEKEVAINCQGYRPDWAIFVDCYGAIAITDSWDVKYISIEDHIHEYEIARIYNLNQYLRTDKNIYVINRKTIEGSSSNGIDTWHRQKLFYGGRLNINEYLDLSEMPTYLVINYTSGEVRAYKGIDEVPQQERGYFREIEDK